MAGSTTKGYNLNLTNTIELPELSYINDLAREKNIEFGDIIEQNYKNNDVNLFFQNLKQEIGFNDYKCLSKYNKYIDFVYKAFENSFETTGGKRIRFFVKRCCGCGFFF